MLELYLLLGLAGVGYAVGSSPTALDTDKKRRRDTASPGYPTTAPPRPSNNTMYDSTYTATADAVTNARAQAKYLQSLQRGGGVMSMNHDVQTDHNIYSSLSGLTVPASEFNHNQQPYFKGSMKQNMDFGANDAILENFAGAAKGSAICSKREIEPMFSPLQSAEQYLTSGGVGGNQGNVDDFWQSRIVPPSIRNNELPAPQIRVGPGLDPQGGFGSLPNSKTSQYEELESQALREKTIDQLRSVDRPKISFATPAPDNAMKTARAGKPGKVTRTIKPGFKTTTDADLLPSAAPYVKDPMEVLPDVRDTNRMATDSYTGVAGASGRARHPLAYGEQSLRDVKPRVENFGVHNAVVHEGAGASFDHGRGAMYSRANERMITSTSAPLGNMGSTVQASIAPYLDELRSTRKAFIDTDRGASVLQPGIPSKQELHEPNTWVARTTIKETNIHDSEWFNLTGPQRTGVYDPDETPRTTVRQTLNNISGGEGNLQGRTFKGKVYDGAEVARITTKQTTERNDNEGNVGGAATRRRGGYQATPYVAHQTQRAALANKEYKGIAGRTAGDGYRVAGFKAPRTQKQSTSQKSHIGIAGDTRTQTSMSYDDAYNANMNEFRQHLLRGRTPTTTGAKNGVGSDSIHQAMHKAVLLKSARTTSTTSGIRPPPVAVAAPPAPNARHPVDEGRLNDRLDASVLRSLRTNPYNIDITAASKAPAQTL